MPVASSLSSSYAIRRILGMISRALAFFAEWAIIEPSFLVPAGENFKHKKSSFSPFSAVKKTAGIFSDRPAVLPEIFFFLISSADFL